MGAVPPHTVRVAGFTDDQGLDIVQLRCTCGWQSSALDSGSFTVTEIENRAAAHRNDAWLPRSHEWTV